MRYLRECLFEFTVWFLTLVYDETIEFLDTFTFKKDRDEIKKINERMGWK